MSEECSQMPTMRDIDAIYRLMAANEKARDIALAKTEIAAAGAATNRLWLIGIAVTIVNIGLKFLVK